jgi:hypothetical protein
LNGFPSNQDRKYKSRKVHQWSKNNDYKGKVLSLNWIKKEDFWKNIGDIDRIRDIIAKDFQS